MIVNLILSLVFLFLLIKSAGYAIRYSSRLARILHFPEFIVSFFVIAIISVLPEASISIISAIKGNAELGFGTLLGSNIMDLTLVFGIVALFSSGGINVKSKILQNNFFYLILLVFPLILGIDGNFSRIDGAILLILGISFFILLYRQSTKFRKKFTTSHKGSFFKSMIFLIASLSILLISALYAVKYAINFSQDIKIPEIVIGMTILALGTCLPELIFSIKAVRENKDELALGDIFGTVITDATIILGAVALISPFSYKPLNIYVLGGAMVLAGIIATFFMKSKKSINKVEGVILILFYVLFLFIEFFINKVFS
jgi:cation:H+ antiporter